MGATGGLMAAQGVSSYYQAEGIKTQGDIQAQLYEQNARLADLKAEDAIRRGDKAATQAQKEISRILGEQVVAFAGQGVDVNTGTASKVVKESSRQAQEDVATIKQNAWLESWGYKIEGIQGVSQANFARIGAQNQASNTLLTGGINALNMGYQGYARQQANKPKSTGTTTGTK